MNVDRVFDAHRAKLNRPMTELEAMAVMSETVAFIRCGHTSVTPGDEEVAEFVVNIGRGSRVVRQ